MRPVTTYILQPNMETLFPAIHRPTEPATAAEPADYEKWWTAFDEEPAAATTTDTTLTLCTCGGEGNDIIIDSIVTCKLCGTVLGRIFDTTAEYRYFANDDRGGDPCRVGAPQDPHLPEASLGTMILGGKGRAMHNIRKFHTYNAMPYKERALLQTTDRLSIIATNNGITNSITDDTRDLFVMIRSLCDRRGLTRDAVLASCLYSSLKKAGCPRKPKEIADMFSLSSATFTKALKYFQEIIALAEQKGLLNKKAIDKSQGSTKATEYISLPLSRLPIPRGQRDKIEAAVRAVAMKAEEGGYSIENVPPSLAAGCIAFVMQYYPDIGVTLADIEHVAGVSIATLQKCLRRLGAYTDILCENAGIRVAAEVPGGPATATLAATLAATPPQKESRSIK
jgi:transcription initiation factor TFIIIB Brf1 subunit/transcription initiation factor TFIIB